MPSRFSNQHKMLVLLPCIFYCANCAPRQKPCVQCALSCDGDDVHELKKHQSVLVDVEHLSETVLHEIRAVSSLFRGEGSCSVVVPDCSKWGVPITLRIYAYDNKSVSDLLYINRALKPVSTDCDPDAVSDRDKLSVADVNLSHTLLVLLLLCFSIFSVRD
ncbi:uncharacterized protein LOC143738203 [Siphateles boraxobius]|uniref:uncharacterized protein LOC143738203 n=1 Tax=Siphateles boraxobius TaxID=180520 RepID=UPI0040636200